jgi:hypothetical protein
MSNLTAILLANQATAIEQISCYSLPYGGIGFASHILTYYTMAALLCGRRPLCPWKRLKHAKRDQILGIIQLVATIIITSLAIHKCLQEWPFAVLGVWMLTTSIAISVLTMGMPYFYRPRCQTVMASEGEAISLDWQPGMESYRREAIRPNLRRAMASERREAIRLRAALSFSEGAGCLLVFVALLWFFGCVAGIVAILFVTGPQYNYETEYVGPGPMYIVTCVFGGLCFFPLVVVGLQACLCRDSCEPGNCCKALVLTPPFICLFALIWMDWSLGIVTGNLAGAPSDNVKALYWSYFAAKRLGLLSA